MSSGDEFTKKVIEKFRVELLDLTKRNNLISFKHSNKSTKQIRVVDEVISNLFDKLISEEELSFNPISVQDNIPEDEKTPIFEQKLEELKLTDEEYHAKKLSLPKEPSEREYLRLDLWLRDKTRASLGMKMINRSQVITIEEHAAKLGIDPSYELKQSSQKKKHTDNVIQTLLYPEQLERRLKSISEQCRLYENEAGINILYMAFGFLEWYESDSSDGKITTPLILIPINIKREQNKGQYSYSISLRDDEISQNLCLEEKLKREFGLQIPPYNPEEDDLGIYLSKVNKLIESKKDWAIKNFATIGFFSFSKISMYRDLNPENWNGTKFEEESLVYSLINGKEQKEIIFAEDYEVDSYTLREKMPLTITDADSSQMSAIFDVVEGKDLVIEGPPGTGKSQTITNIIAAALSKNKKVLFISEKKAALEVVKNRLDKAGLGVFCLELHSSKTKRADVAKAMSDNVSMRSKRRTSLSLSEEVRLIELIKRDIKSYISKLHFSYVPLQESFQSLIWKSLQLNSRYEKSDLFNTTLIQDFEKIDSSKLESINSEIRKFLLYSGECGVTSTNYPSYIWKPFATSNINSKKVPEFCTDIELIVKGLDRFLEEHSSVEVFKEQVKNISVSQTISILKYLENKTFDFNKIIFDVFKDLDTKEFEATLQSYILNEKQILETSKAIKSIDSSFDISIFKEFLDFKIPGTNRDDIQSLKISQLSKEIETLNKLGFALSEAELALQEVLGLIELPVPKNVKETKELELFITDLYSFPDSLIQYVSPELASYNSKEMIKVLRKKANDLKEQKNSLQRDFTDTIFAVTPTEVSNLLFEFRNYNIFSWFRSSFRKARKFIKQCNRGLNNKAAHISTLLDNLERFQTGFDNHIKSKQYIELVKDDRLGLEAPLDEIESTIDLVSNFKTKYPESKAFTAKLQEVFTKKNSEVLGKSKRLLSHPSVLDSLRFLITKLNEYERDRVETLTNHLAGRIERIQHFVDIDRRFGISSELTIQEVSKLHILSLTSSSLYNNRASFQSSFASLSKSPEFNNLLYTLELHNNIKSSGIPAVLKDYIYKQDTTLGLQIVFDVLPSLKPCSLSAQNALNALFEKWGLSCHQLFNYESFEKMPAHLLKETFQELLKHKSLLLPFLQFDECRKTLFANGLSDLFHQIVSNKVNFEELQVAFETCFYNTILKTFFDNNHELKKNMGISLMELRHLFREQDKKLIQLHREELKLQFLKNPLVDGNSRGRVKEYTEMGFINHQISLSRGHAPIREYFLKAPDSTLSIKPCLMMSPLSISQYLPSADFSFDLVVMDEASQLKPEDALGAILRASQVVVVGDPKQLPPTAFFNFSSDSNNSDDEEDDVFPDYESILDMALKSFKPARRLKWHYRSKHETLISPSNKNFYDGDLVIFPSPHFNHDDFGLHYKYVENGVYQGRKNVIEAQEIIKYLIDHVEKHPTKSLGIVTTNQAQQELVNDLVDVELRENVILQQFMTKHENSLEPLIIKNLENIQGDERDVILISTVYGKEPGATKFHQRFGPINGKMGHRRLNVLFTRARYKTVVFSSLDPDLIVADASSSFGLRVFKDFLSIAKYKQSSLIASTGEPDSDFEIFVMNAIREQGFEVQCQVGVSGYKIDLAIVHPKFPGKYMLGIECDGATYHSSKSARDRDKIRQEILESLGWKIYRIWSTDWFNDPKKEIQKLLEEIKKIA